MILHYLKEFGFDVQSTPLPFLHPVKILGNGELNSKINITATSFSTTAKQKIEKAGF